MALQSITNINVDFNDKKYILINAKQFDDISRWISITCYDNGKLFNLNPSNYTAYIRYRKADGYGVLNSCRINYKSEVLVELTEQMLAAVGVCYVDLIIVEKGKAIVNIDNGSIITIDESPIISTMAFCVNVYEASVDNSLIESSYEFDALNDALKMANAEYKEVIQLSKSYAIGDANDIRENEDFDNSKYYSKLSKSYAIGDLDGATGTKDRKNEKTDNAEYYSRLAKSYAKGDLDGGTNTRNNEAIDNAQYYSQMSKSYAMGGTGIEIRSDEDTNNAEYYSRLAKSYTMGSFDGDTNTRDNELSENAKTYMDTTKSYMDNTKSHMDTTGEYMNTTESYMNDTKSYMDTTESYMNNTNEYMNSANEYMNNAQTSETNAAKSELNAKSSEEKSLTSEQNAKVSETNAKTSETNASVSEKNAKNAQNAAEIAENNAKQAASQAAAQAAEEAAELAAQNAVDNVTTLMSGYVTTSQEAAISAENSKKLALENADRAQSYAVGGSGTRDGEDTDNAHYYYESIKNIVSNLDIATVGEVKDYLGI